MVMTLVLCQSAATQASDIDIYSNATGGKVTLMLAIDTSRSMEEADDHTLAQKDFGIPINASGSNACYFGEYSSTQDTQTGLWGVSNQTLRTETTTRSGITYTRKYCQIPYNGTYYARNATNEQCEVLPNNGGLKCFDRLTLVKDGLFDLLLGNVASGIQPISDDKIIGLSNFAVLNEQTLGSTTGTSNFRGSMIVVPARPLSEVVNGKTQRTLLLEGIAQLKIDGVGGTPSAALLAETASYLMSRSPLGSSSVVGQESFRYRNDVTTNRWQKCNAWATEANKFKACTSWVNSNLSDAPKTTRASKSHWFDAIYRPVRYADGNDYYISMSIKYGSGFFNSSISTRTNSSYVGPTSISSQASFTTSEKECNGQGIYYLTDGEPNEKLNPQEITRATLNSNDRCTDTNSCFTSLVNNLFTTTSNPAGVSIRTAVVGFGKDINGIASYDSTPLVVGQKKSDGTLATSSEVTANINRNINAINASSGTTGAKNTAIWGIRGRGGWYSGNSSADIVNSVNKFLNSISVTIPTMATGSPTLPQDALNPLRIQPYGYYALFTPKPQETTQLWAGNLNKYHVYNGELYNSSKTIRLIKSDGSLESTANGLWSGGMNGKLPVGFSLNAKNEQIANRTIYTNRQITDSVPYEANTLSKINVMTLFGTGSTALFVNDPDKNYWLNLLGYNVGATETGVTLESLAAKPELRQVGAVMHSTPILLTQRGKITYSSGAIDTTDRDDYLLFGSTQGLLHVVDADTGVEKFAFAPNEMMQNQKAAFLSETSSTGGSANLFYGIDAPWTAYTQYVSKADGTLTVNSSDRTSDGSTNTDLALKGLQWVYGGLRMGGRSYYALNLSDLDSPSLKFHINPDAAVTAAGVPDTTNALSYMGQSWSKPTLAYVKFGGVKKLVMFVGGGYDAGYENAAYDQNTTTGSGAGVYMFDADSGDLLWWTSANATAAKGAQAFTDASASTVNMKYSVVSQINAIDRDDDGLVDNLYLGDLGGQAFRVDLNNAATGTDASAKKANFATRVVRLFSEHASGGASPRFYEMPSVSIHDGDNGYVAAVAFSSGNRSSPLVGTAAANSNQAGSTVSAADGVFVVYDKDVAKSDLYTLTDSVSSTQLTTKNISLTSLNTNISTGVAITGNNGWKYIYSSTAGVYKGMNDLYAVDGMLYVNVYHRDGTGIGGTCGAGVKGDSYIYQFCLPTGKCSFNTTTTGKPNSVKIGAGILGSGLGQDLGSNNSRLTVTRPDSLDYCTTDANKNKPECQQFSTTAKLRQLRWYETR